jgi:hypothetical protein
VYKYDAGESVISASSSTREPSIVSVSIKSSLSEEVGVGNDGWIDDVTEMGEVRNLKEEEEGVETDVDEAGETVLFVNDSTRSDV